MSVPDIFSRSARRQQRSRAAAAFAAHDFLRAAMLEGIADRLASVTREFVDVLDLGCFDHGFAAPPGAHVIRADPAAGFSPDVQCEEDRLPFADHSFDLVVSAGVLDSVNDLPGALTLVRRTLRPDGLFLGAFVGAGSLSSLRAAIRQAEPDRAAARLHPQIDVRSAGDLLLRTGFALPVADIETLKVRYRDLGGLLRDLRGMGAANVLADRVPLTRGALTRMAGAFQALAAPDGRITETFNLIFVTGWSPAPSQPQPARRGSAGASLAQALGRRE